MTPAEIKAARLRVELTQAEAAAIKGWTRDAWVKLESGARTISPHDWAYWLHRTGLKRIPFRRV